MPSTTNQALAHPKGSCRGWSWDLNPGLQAHAVRPLRGWCLHGVSRLLAEWKESVLASSHERAPGGDPVLMSQPLFRTLASGSSAASMSLSLPHSPSHNTSFTQQGRVIRRTLGSNYIVITIILGT